MTRGEFERQYQVIRKVSGGPVATSHAFASSGTVVMVHEIDPSAAREAVLLAGMMARLPDEERSRILDVLEVDGSTVIVTRFLLDHVSLRSWLEAVAGPEGDGDAAVPPPAGAPATSDAIPVVTTLSRAPERVSSDPGEDPTASGTGLPDEGPSGEDGLGEFTRMFQAVPADPPEPEDAERSVETGSPEDAGSPEDFARSGDPRLSDEPGEFTRMFQAVTPGQPASSVPPAPPASPPPPLQAESPVPPAPVPPTPVPPAPPLDTPPASPPAEDPEGQEPGEFTRMFRAVAPPAPAPDEPAGASPAQVASSPPSASPVPPPPSSAPSAPDPGPAPGPLPPAAPEAGSPKPGGTQAGDAGPGEFTRMFQAVVPPRSPASPPPPPPASPSPAAFPPSAAPPPPPPASPPASSTGGVAAGRPGDAGGGNPSGEAGAQGPGEFTRIFGAQTAPASPAPNPPPLQYSRPPAQGGGGQGESEDAYRARLGALGSTPFPSSAPEERPVASSGPSPLDLPVAPSAPPPPGEYTRIIQAAERPSGPSAGGFPGGGFPPQGLPGAAVPPPAGYPPPPQQAPAPAPKSGGISGVTLVLGILAVVLLAVVIVGAFFLFGRDGGEEPPAGDAVQVEAPAG